MEYDGDKAFLGADKIAIWFENKLAITSANIGVQFIFKRIQLGEVSEIQAVAYNRFNDSLILTDSKKIFQYDLTTDRLSVLVEDGLKTVESLVVDNTGDNLYLVDSGRNTVEVISLKTRARIVLLSNMTNLCDLVIEPEQG